MKGTKKMNQKRQATQIKRRHWYDHEKLDIIRAYDAGELLKVPGSSPVSVSDPKSGEELRIALIELWKSQFKSRGLDPEMTTRRVERRMDVQYGLKPGPQQPKTKSVTERFKPYEGSGNGDNSNQMQKLLVSTLLENEYLKTMVNELKGQVRELCDR